MEKFKNVMKAFAKDDSGAAMVEYAVILVVVVLVGGAVLATIGTNISAIFTSVAACLKAPATGCALPS
jgi:Flp pilus assembly pilin Flp